MCEVYDFYFQVGYFCLLVSSCAMGTCIVPHGIICEISLTLDSEKTKHPTTISVKFSMRECISNHKQIDLKMYTNSQ